MATVGVDWASGRWITVRYGDDITVSTEPSILNVWHEHRTADRILVDVPIGLPGKDIEDDALINGRRKCDVMAREMLPTDRRSSVFPVPCRDAVYTEDYDDAADTNKDHLGLGLSAQSWAIAPQIREVDVFLQEYPDAQGILRESHPEVCFAELASEGAHTTSKHSEDGVSARKGILNDDLQSEYETIADRAEDRSWKPRITATRTDDVLDAMVLAMTAAGETRPLPSPPHNDREGLPMEIVVPDR